MGKCQSAKRIDKIFLKFSFIVALQVHFLLQIGILNVKGIRKHVTLSYLEIGGTTPAPTTRKKGCANFFGRLTFLHKNGSPQVQEF